MFELPENIVIHEVKITLGSDDNTEKKMVITFSDDGGGCKVLLDTKGNIASFVSRKYFESCTEFISEVCKAIDTQNE